MMRGALILGSVGTLVAMGLATPPRTVSAVHESPGAQTSTAIADSYDTLTEADRQEPYRYAQIEAPTLPVSPDLPTSSVGLARASSQEPREGTRRHTPSTSKQKVAAVPIKSRRKIQTSAKGSRDRSDGVAVVHKSCRQNVLDSLLNLLSLSRGCEA